VARLRDPFTAVVLATVAAACTTMERVATTAEPALPGSAALRALSGALVPNQGQWPAHVCYATTGREPLWIEHDAIVMSARAPAGGEQVIRLRVLDADPDSAPRGEHALAGTHNFFVGDRASWRSGLVAHDRVRWSNVRPGIDLVVTTAGQAPEYLIELAAGADLAGLKFRCEGAERVEVQPDGSLRVDGAALDLVQSAPLAVRLDAGGNRTPERVAFVAEDATTFGFVAPVANGAPLCIDPMLQWATFVGGSAYEWGYDICRENDGTVLVVGETTSSNFPTTPGVFDPTYNGSGPPTSDVFVARINAAGTGAIYASYLGGSGADKGMGVSGNGSGVATIVGAAGSANFPVSPGAYDTALGGSSDAFVTRLTADGTALVFSTLLGGSGDDTAEDLAVTANGETWVTGVTSSPSFPTTAGAYSSTRSGTSDVFVARISATGAQLLASSLLGGSSGEVGKGVAVGPASSVVIGGVTSSSNFPTTPGAFQPALLGSSDAFVARLSDTCQQLLASTLVGGSGGDVGEAVAVTNSGLALVAGVTSSNDFPATPGAFQLAPSGASDAFVAAFDAGGQRRWATLVGGNGGDVGKSVSVTGDGTVVVGGQCSSSVFPTTPGAVLAAGSGSADAFVAHLAFDGSGLLAATLFGGSGSDGGEAIDGRNAAAVALTGVCNSGNLPVTPGAWSGSQLGTNDSFAAVLDLRAAGVVTYGASTPSCLGAVSVSATRWPAANAADFGIACVQAPPFTVGLLVLGFAPWPGVPIVGVTAWIDLSLPTIMVTALSDDLGASKVPLSLAGISAGGHFYAQFAWLNPPGCGTPGGFSASNALDILVQ
jgi:hypothetical protein